MDSLFYFFSSLAQTFGTVAGFVYVAAQFRIQWLDGLLTTEKLLCADEIYGDRASAEDAVLRYKVTDIIRQSEQRLLERPEGDRLRIRVDELKKHYKKIVETRVRAHRLTAGMVIYAAIALIQLPFCGLFAESPLRHVVLGLNIAVTAVLALLVARFIKLTLIVGGGKSGK